MGLLAFSDAIVAVVVDGYRCFVQVRELANGRVTNFCESQEISRVWLPSSEATVKSGGRPPEYSLAQNGTLGLYPVLVLQPSLVRLRKIWRSNTILTSQHTPGSELQSSRSRKSSADGFQFFETLRSCIRKLSINRQDVEQTRKDGMLPYVKRPHLPLPVDVVTILTVGYRIRPVTYASLS